jgi:hypothetical protein
MVATLEGAEDRIEAINKEGSSFLNIIGNVTVTSNHP